MGCANCGRPVKSGSLCPKCTRLAAQHEIHRIQHRDTHHSGCPACRGFRPGDEIETGRMGDPAFEVALVLEVGGTILKLRRLDGSERFAHAAHCRLIRARRRPRRGLQ